MKYARMPRPKRPLKMPYEGPTTPAQQRVIDDLMLGHTNKDIAVSLGIAEQTVRSHLSHIFIKYGVENRGALILAEHERLEKLKCQASAAADNELTPQNTSRRRLVILEPLRKRKTLLRLRPSLAAR